ncbi:hypothetical protein MHU86_16700 [Fragilaria crotonensis]|nr:hypothetical protein MHU86_16700 [Fragilaria crotonensis]
MSSLSSDDDRVRKMLIRETDYGDPVMVRILLRNGTDLNRQYTVLGKTALTMACDAMGNLEVLRVLLKHDTVDVNCPDSEGERALIVASRSGNLGRRSRASKTRQSGFEHPGLYSRVKSPRFWKRGYRSRVVEARRFQHKPPLGAIYGAIRELLKFDIVDVNVQDQDGQTALTRACVAGKASVLDELLKHDRVDVNIQDSSGHTALTMACEMNNSHIIRKLLIRDKVDVNLRDCRGRTALVISCSLENWEMVSLLLRRGDVDVSCQNELGETVLMVIASSRGGSDATRELLKRNTVDVNCRDRNGRTALIRASSAGNLEVIRELLKHDELNVNAKDHKGRTAFYWASPNNHWGVYDALLEYDEVDVNAKGAHGNTALIWACLKGRLDIVCKLLKDGRVDASLRNKAGSTALDVSRNLELIEITACLEEHAKSGLRRKWEANVEIDRKKKQSRRGYLVE